MTTSRVDLNAYMGRKIKFLYTPPVNSTEQGERLVEGVVQLVSADALLLKEKGTIMLRLIEFSGINFETLELVNEPPREIKQRKVDSVSVSSVRNHLLDRHGYKISVINETSDEQAFKFHAAIDHTDLGHTHEVRE